MLMEGNLKREIQESMKSFQEYYEVKEVEIDDKKVDSLLRVTQSVRVRVG